jgi:hypothetical protein
MVSWMRFKSGVWSVTVCSQAANQGMIFPLLAMHLNLASPVLPATLEG